MRAAFPKRVVGLDLCSSPKRDFGWAGGREAAELPAVCGHPTSSRPWSTRAGELNALQAETPEWVVSGRVAPKLPTLG
jgi:hypothetical protein